MVNAPVIIEVMKLKFSSKGLASIMDGAAYPVNVKIEPAIDFISFRSVNGTLFSLSDKLIVVMLLDHYQLSNLSYEKARRKGRLIQLK